MSKQRVVVTCWRHGHNTELFMTKRGEERLTNKIHKMLSVCPECRDSDNGNQAIFIKEGQTIFDTKKLYQCRHGHVTRISAFKHGVLSVTFSNDRDGYVNVDGSPDELDELIDSKTIACNHKKDNGRVCGCKLYAADDKSIELPTVPGIKTKTRVGDIWDKEKIDPVRPGKYDNDGNYHSTRSEQANKERIKRMQRKRLMSEDKHPGKRMERPTKRRK